MTVVAECHDCGDVHPLEDRRAGRGTTLCPACDSPRYSSESTEDPVKKSESERIRDAIKDVEGVGEKNLEAVVEAFSSLAGLRAADAGRLESIEGVGSVVAERIADEVREPIGGFEWVGDAEGSA